MTRNQLRSAIRWEAVIISVLGTLVGLAIGLILSRALVQALEGFGLTTFAVPVGTLVVGRDHRRPPRGGGVAAARAPGVEARRAEGDRHGVAPHRFLHGP